MKRKYYIYVVDEIQGYTIKQAKMEFNPELFEIVDVGRLFKGIIEKIDNKLDKHKPH